MAAEMLGPAHHLCSRLIARELPKPREVLFLSPLHLKAGKPHRGSDLHNAKFVRRLLTIADPKRRPDLALVLVDEDGDAGRRRELTAALQDVPQLHVIAVPIREFEAWLIADQRALVDILQVTDTPPEVEGMKPRQAKELLRGWIDASALAGASQSERAAQLEQVRSSLARQVSLDALDKLRAMKLFRDDLRTAIGQIGH
jgi:hypothetical protein